MKRTNINFSNASVQTLDISNTKLHNSSITILCEILKVSQCLVKLNLAYCGINSSRKCTAL